MEVVVALFVLQLWEGGGTSTMVDDDGMEVVAALFVFNFGKVVALNNGGSLLGKENGGRRRRRRDHSQHPHMATEMDNENQDELNTRLIQVKKLTQFSLIMVAFYRHVHGEITK